MARATKIICFFVKHCNTSFFPNLHATEHNFNYADSTPFLEQGVGNLGKSMCIKKSCLVLWITTLGP
jgi:hypothetical protein